MLLVKSNTFVYCTAYFVSFLRVKVMHLENGTHVSVGPLNEIDI